MRPFLFPKSANKVGPALVFFSVAIPAYAIALYFYALSPSTIDVGYAPIQPIPFSHALHAGELGMDCRYCHNTVETSARASIPSTQSCMTCHQTIRADSPNLQALRDSYESGQPVEWVRVHDLPDFVYFDHSAHVLRGVSCVSCHGRVDKMEVVTQVEPLRMSWCLECHRNPEPHIRPQEFVTNMQWRSITTMAVHATEDPELQALLRSVNPSQDCSTCHR